MAQEKGTERYRICSNQEFQEAFDEYTSKYKREYESKMAQFMKDYLQKHTQIINASEEVRDEYAVIVQKIDEMLPLEDGETLDNLKTRSETLEARLKAYGSQVEQLNLSLSAHKQTIKKELSWCGTQDQMMENVQSTEGLSSKESVKANICDKYRSAMIVYHEPLKIITYTVIPLEGCAVYPDAYCAYHDEKLKSMFKKLCKHGEVKVDMVASGLSLGKDDDSALGRNLSDISDISSTTSNKENTIGQMQQELQKKKEIVATIHPDVQLNPSSRVLAPKIGEKRPGDEGDDQFQGKRVKEYLVATRPNAGDERDEGDLDLFDDFASSYNSVQPREALLPVGCVEGDEGDLDIFADDGGSYNSAQPLGSVLPEGYAEWVV